MLKKSLEVWPQKCEPSSHYIRCSKPGINGGNIFFIYLLTVMQQGYPVMAQPTNYQTSNTTVVVNQPAPIVFQQGMRDWSSDLCGCCEDCYSCELNNLRCRANERNRKIKEKKRKAQPVSSTFLAPMLLATISLSFPDPFLLLGSRR